MATVQRRHEMKEFGRVSGLTSQIRVDRLEERLTPLVPFPHRHSFFHMLVISAGKGWHDIDFVRNRVGASQVHFMRPGQVHSWSLSTGTRGYVIEFASGKEHSLDRLVAFYSGGVFDQLLTLTEQMHSEYVGQSTNWEVLLQLYLSALLVSLARATGTQAAEKKPNTFVDRFLELVEEQYRRHHAVEPYAGRLNVSPKALTMRVSRALGKSARDVIHERCLLESKRLLAYSDLGIAEIGYELGFEDPNYFSRFFRQAERMSPGQFREKVKPGSGRGSGSKSRGPSL